MDRRTLITIILCFAIFYGWQKFYLEPRTPAPKASPKQTQTQSVNSVPEVKTSSRSNKELETRAVEVKNGTLVVSNGPALVNNWILKNYSQDRKKKENKIDLHWVTHEMQNGFIGFDSPELGYLTEVQGDLHVQNHQIIWSYEDSKIHLVRKYQVNPEQSWVDLEIRAQFKSVTPKYVFLMSRSRGITDDPEAIDRGIALYADGGVSRYPVNDSVELESVSYGVDWIGSVSRYFILGFAPTGEIKPTGLIQPLGSKQAQVSLVYPVSSKEVTLPVRMYFGAKDVNTLRLVGSHLDEAVDFGWFTVLALPLLKLMKWLYQFFQNYGLAIIVLTLIVRLAVYPLTYKSMKSMKKMSALQPQLQKIKERYKDDREAFNREMLVMMRTQGYNPLSGCLPIIVQLPIFFALYRVLYSSVELYQAPFFFWIQDLSAKDPYYVTPVLMGVLMFFQQKLTPSTTMDPTQQKILQFMPLIFTGFMLTLPSGLTLYMLVSSMAGIAQQLILNKKFDVKPQAT